MASHQVNLAIIVCVVAYLLSRIHSVGFLEALAELVGIAQAEFYIEWRDAYVPLHPALFDTAFNISLTALVPAVDAALAVSNTTARRIALRSLVTDHGYGVFSLPLLRPEFCALLASEACISPSPITALS